MKTKEETKGMYLLSAWVESPKSLELMEGDMINGGIAYGIAILGRQYALFRDAKNIGLQPTKVEIDGWHKPFRKRKTLEEKEAGSEVY